MTSTEATEPVKYPESDKMHAVHAQSQAIGEFLEWLQYSKGWHLAAYQTELEFEPGERYVVEEAPYRGVIGYRVLDRGGFREYVGRRFDTREEAEQLAARKDAEWLEIAEENQKLRVQPFSIERLLAEFFRIDLDKIEAERRQMLEEIRAAQG